MAIDGETPCGVLFDTFKSFAGISNHDVAEVILSDRPMAGGRSPRQRIDDKSYLSRIIVHSRPGDLSPSTFVDFQQSAHTLFSLMRSSAGSGLSALAISDYFGGIGAREMAHACEEYGLDDRLYLNTVNRLTSLKTANDVEVAYLLVLLFLETGCLQDTRAASGQVISYVERELNTQPATQATQEFNNVQPKHAKDVRLALFRVIDNRIRGRAHTLSIEPEGTEIGYLATGPDSITDVEGTVSRHHLRIFRDIDGIWYAQGLGSRNGSILVSGEDRSETVIEPPREEAAGVPRIDVQIRPGDQLRLARDIVFMVVQIDPE